MTSITTHVFSPPNLYPFSGSEPLFPNAYTYTLSPLFPENRISPFPNCPSSTQGSEGAKNKFVLTKFVLNEMKRNLKPYLYFIIFFENFLIQFFLDPTVKQQGSYSLVSRTEKSTLMEIRYNFLFVRNLRNIEQC